MTNIKLASGRGQYHTDKTKPLESITFAQIEQMLEQPQQCDKSEAKWFIPCNVLTRSKDKQNALNALFYCLWADLDDMQGETLQTLADYACNELLPLGLGSVKVLAYNTKSASNENQKSRLILPTAKPLGIDDFIRCQTVLNDKLEAMGVTPDRATQRPVQICYLPNKGVFYQSINQGNQPLEPLTFWRDELAKLEVQQRQAEKDRQQRLEQSRIRAAQRVASGTYSPIQAFNDAYSLDDLLTAYGYMQTDNNRYLSPNSTSGMAGLEFKNGRYITAHQSDISIGLPQSGDAFDLFKFYEHNNDQNKALKAAGAMFTTDGGISLTKANQCAYMQKQAEYSALISFDNLTCNTRPIQAPILVDSDGVISEQSNEPDSLTMFDVFDAQSLMIVTDFKVIDWRLKQTHARDHLTLLTDDAKLAEIGLMAEQKRFLVVFLGDATSTQRLASYENQYVKLATVDINALNATGTKQLVKVIAQSINPYFSTSYPLPIAPRFFDVTRDKEGNEKGALETLLNFKTLLEWEGVSLRYKVIGRTVEWRDGYGCKGDTADGDRLTKLISAAKKYRLPTTMIADYVATVASENEFNPVLSYITRQPWDQQTDYIGQLFSTLTLADGFDASLAVSYLKKWMISAVMLATADKPQEAHGVFILQSDNHGAGKGRWFKRLVADIDPDLLGNGGLDVRDKDSVIRIAKKWIFELSEIETSMNRREIGELKSFITTDMDEVRAPYARAAQKLPRRTAFCGSANNKQFLSDPSGSRRFWVIPITKADYQHNVNMQQAWAHAYHLYQAGDPWWLSHDEIEAVTRSNDANFQALCPIAEALEAHFRWDKPSQTWDNFLTPSDALCQCFGVDYRPNQTELNKASAFIRKRCGERVTRRIGKQPVKGYLMPERTNPFS
jgi:hypothetical protein